MSATSKLFERVHSVMHRLSDRRKQISQRQRRARAEAFSAEPRFEQLEDRSLLSIAYSVNENDDELYRIDTDTGTAASVGPVGFDDVEGLAFHPTLGVLYGVDDDTDQLITIDLTTGVGTVVGSLGVAGLFDPGLAFDYAGNLFMSTSEQEFYSVDPNTGAATQIGAADAQGQSVVGLAFGPTAVTGTDALFGLGGGGTNNLVTIDTTTGVATEVGPLVNVIVLGEGGLDFFNGVLFGIHDGDGADPAEIFTLNTTTGEATVVSTTLDGFEGLAFEPFADLVTTYSIAPASTVGTDNGLVFTVDVVNLGPAIARNVRVTDRIFGFNLPIINIQSGAMSVSQSGGAITQFTVVTGQTTGSNQEIGVFRTDHMDVGGVLRIEYRIETFQSGMLSSVANATSETPDPAIANNTAAVELFVLPNIFVDDDGNLIIRDVAGEGRDDNLTIKLSGGSLIISDPDHTLTSATGTGFGGLQNVGTQPANEVTLSLGGVDRIIIETGLGNDSLTVDESGGAISVPISYEGGAGSDSLTFTGGTATSDTYTVGPDIGAGTSTIVISGVTQTVSFTGLEPVIDLVAGPLTVNGTPAANAINYTQGSVATNGMVTVDNFESIEFSNKTTLTINGGAGSDEINLNNTTLPTGLTGITINGGDPTADSDTLIVNDAVNGTAMDVTPTGANSATITGAQTVPVTATDIEGLTINGLGGNDTLEITGTGRITYRAGDAVDSGSFTVGSLVPVGFTNLGATGSLVVDGTGTETLVIEGDGLDNNFTLSHSSTLGGTAKLDNQLTITHDLTSEDRIELVGGDPSASDAMLLTVTFDGTMTINLNTETITGFGASVVTSGVEAVDLVFSGAVGTFNVTELGTESDLDYILLHGGGDEALTLTGSESGGISAEGDDFIQITPTLQDRGYIQEASQPYLIEYTGITGTFVVNGGTNGVDVLQIIGNDLGNTLTSTSATVLNFDVDSGGAILASNITLGSGLDRLEIDTGLGNDTVALAHAIALPVVVNSGDGDDSVTATALTTSLTVLAGNGNDAVTGGTVGDLLDGGDGNDTITGGAGDDRIEGGEGDDLLSGGTGNDQLFGGTGSDRFVWAVGDGNDLVEGGSGEGDELLVTGNASANRFEVFGGGAGFVNPSFPAVAGDASRAIVALDSTAFLTATAFVDTSDVEAIHLDLQGEADEAIINNQVPNTSTASSFLQAGTDLASTHVTSITVDVGSGDATADRVEVHGRTTADDVMVRSLGLNFTLGTVDVAGFAYSIDINQSISTDTLIVRGQSGNDTVKAEAGTEIRIGLRLDGDEGDDVLSADATLIGGTGNDTLEGGTGADSLVGDAGDDLLIGQGGVDTMVGGAGNDSFISGAGNDSIDGGADFDSILVAGTPGDDTISLDQSSATALTATVNGVADTDTLVTDTVEEVAVAAGDGDDHVSSVIEDGLASSDLRVAVDGGTGFDRFVVVDDGEGDLVLQRENHDLTGGTVTVGPALANPYFATYRNTEFADPIVGAEGRLVVFHHDGFEHNNNINNPTWRGAPDNVDELSATIVPGEFTPFNSPGDNDFFKFKALRGGLLVFDVLFDMIPVVDSGRAGLPGAGDLNIEVFNSDFELMDTLANGLVASTTDAEGEHKSVLVNEGDTIYLRVFGATGVAVNKYDLLTTLHAALLGEFAFTAASQYRLDVGNGPRSVATGQFNDDNEDGVIDANDNLDLITANSLSHTVTTLMGVGDGSFGFPVNIGTGGKGPSVVVLGHMNDDNEDGVFGFFDANDNGEVDEGEFDLIDAVVSNYRSKSISIFRGLGGDGGGFELDTILQVGAKPLGIALADIDGDDDTDIVVANNKNVAVLLSSEDESTGGGAVAPVVLSPSLSNTFEFDAISFFTAGGKGVQDVVVGDLNDDGNLDIVTANNGSNNMGLLYGTGDFSIDGSGRFSSAFDPAETIKVRHRPKDVAIADFDGNGIPDLASVDSRGYSVNIVRGLDSFEFDGHREFSQLVSIVTGDNQRPVAVTIANINNDGLDDILFDNRRDNTFSILKGQGDGSFAGPFDFPTGDTRVREPASIVVGDFNGDGMLDIAIANAGTDDVSVLLRRLFLVADPV